MECRAVTSDGSWRPPRPGNPIVYGWGAGGQPVRRRGEADTTATRAPPPGISGFVADDAAAAEFSPHRMAAVAVDAASAAASLSSSAAAAVVAEPADAEPDAGPAVSPAERYYYSPALHGTVESVGMSSPYTSAIRSRA